MKRIALVVVTAATAAFFAGSASAAPNPVTVKTDTSDGVAVSVTVEEKKTGATGGVATKVGSSEGLVCAYYGTQRENCVG